MKKEALLLFFLLCFTTNFAQKSYEVKNENLTLTEEISGALDLLWTTTNNEYRYFVKTSDNNISELLNTKTDNGFQEEFKATLATLTEGSGVSVNNLKFTLFALAEFFKEYNAIVDATYSPENSKRKLHYNLGVFAGATNSPFVENPENSFAPTLGAELEVSENYDTSRHSGFLQLKQTFEADKLDYQTFEIALAYRFKFINGSKFNLYGNLKLATVNFSSSTEVYLNENSELITNHKSESSFDVPMIFGIGADFKVGEKGYITLGYNELFALFFDNQGNFPVNLNLGYKFKL
ncbi:MAG: hypothetical protein BM564_04620 [Bacteroidetes bacterium MedPE-SWsnd-G2]|mgnify:CR=1 FL=1|nr:MAG: hypothetical protein BM564_04620 [Bacteroidetes bacterium MedPE-SWsnd-G2]